MQPNNLLIFLAGALIGVLGGLIGLGGAEFRLPLLISIFGFVPLEAIILNKAMSLIVVSSALPSRMSVIPFSAILSNGAIVANMLSGSVIGAWLGASWATRLSTIVLYRTIAALLVGIAIVLVAGHNVANIDQPLVAGAMQTVVGAIAGFFIGIAASLLGVAGGELLIPTLILLFGVDIKLAGSLSLSISLPTMIAGFARYSLDKSFTVLSKHISFVFIMALGSVAGSCIGSLLLGIVANSLLFPILAAILLVSAVKIWRHG